MNNIQRKFLVSADIERWIEKYTPAVIKTEQFYVSTMLEARCYYLKQFPDTYTKVTVDTMGHKETSSVIREVYKAQRKKHMGRVIVKKSYTVSIGDDLLVVEKYVKKLEGLYILVGHFKDEQAARDSKIIPLTEVFVIKEIGKDEKYSDPVLALGVKPMEYNIHTLFDKIDAFESPNLFFWQVQPYVYAHDGVCLVLYRNIRLLNHYKMSFQKKHFASTLHRLRVLLRRTATLLEIFPDLFNADVQKYCTDALHHYHEDAKVLRYLYFLDELCAMREDAKLTLYTELKSRISQEEQRVKKILSSDPFTHVLNTLTEEVKRFENRQYTSLKKEIKNETRKRLGKFEILLAQTKEGYDDKALEELYDVMDFLQTLIEDFFHIIGEKEARLIVEEINILLKPLREYRNCKERTRILQTIKDNSETKTLNTEPLLCEHEEMLENKIAHALKLLRGSRFYM